MENKDLKIELTKSIEEQITKMKKNTGDNTPIRSMDYFYEAAKNIYRINNIDSSTPVVGTFCNMIPEELILAVGAKPLRICGGFQGTIPISESILPQVYCPLIKSSVGFFMKNMLNDLNMLIVPTTCDGKKKAAEILAEKITTLIMEVPHTIESPQARELWLREVMILKRNLTSHLSKKITRKGLRQAIEKTNKKRALLRELYELRKKNPPILGADALLVTHMSFYSDLDSWITHTEALVNELKVKEAVREEPNLRVMLTGAPVILPTWKIPLLIEESGGLIVMDDLCSGAKMLLRNCEVRSWNMYDMLIGLADYYLMSGCPCFVPNNTRITRILNDIKDYQIDGVVYHNLSGCQLYGGEAWRVEKALKKQDIPVLRLETSYGEGDIKQLKIRVDAFIEMLEARKEV
ncbi:MAG: 2-hydroxyacyl-CoA dehydratase [Methanomassiliicoccales archaeon]|nr:MAG: 2-hydroxyacyl-CoA dehydratase [Methanomassiliicoccales archaeon]